MEEQKIYVCPNCGETTTDAEYCEHCGSLLVRFAAHNIDISNTLYTDDSLVFPGLIEELKKNKMFQNNSDSDGWIWTDIRWINKEGKEDNILVRGCADEQTAYLFFNYFFYEPTNKESPDYNEFARFSKLYSFPLFTCDIHNEESVLKYDYGINCGKDAEGMARIISEFLIKVKGISLSDNYGVITIWGDDDDFGAWFEEHGFSLEDHYWGKDRPEPEDTEAFISSFKDLVIEALTNGSNIKKRADNGDTTACFQMGMIHLLGINTPIDFKKAIRYFGSHSLSDNQEANRWLGFIQECEGNYSAAFTNYANAAGKTGNESTLPYLRKVFEERSRLQNYFKKVALPNLFNILITSIINEYILGDKSKVDASIKLATLCDDEITCLEAAQSLYDAGDLYSAKRWLQMGNVANTNELFIAIENKLSDSMNSLKLSDILQVIDVKGSSLLTDLNLSSSFTGIKQTIVDVAATCRQTWMEEIPKLTAKIVNRLDEEEEIERINEHKLKLKEKTDTFGFCVKLIVLAISGYYLFSNYSFYKALFILLIIYLICDGVWSYVEKKLGLDSDDD